MFVPDLTIPCPWSRGSPKTLSMVPAGNETLRVNYFCCAVHRVMGR